MKEIIINLTQKKKDVLTVPADMHTGDIKILIKKIMLQLQASNWCPHDKADYDTKTKIATCDGCGKQLN